MSILDQAVRERDAAALGDRPARRTGSRSRASLLMGLSLVLVAAWWAAPRSVALGEEVRPAFVEGARAVELPQFGDGGSYVLAYEDGSYGKVLVPLRNERPFAVTIDRARLTDGPRSLATVVAAGVDGGAGLPLRLAPGEESTLALTVRFDNCDYYHERALEQFDGALLDVSVLGSGSTVGVSFDRPVLVRSPMIVDCPDRLIDRQAKTRRGG